MEESNETPAPESPSREELKLALQAFNKRLRLTRLDDESRIGRGAREAASRASWRSDRPISTPGRRGMSW